MGELAESLGRHAWVWSAVLALGAFHGANPAMGWLFAVSNGMQARRTRAVFAALPPIALGHFLAMAAALLPVALLGLYLERLGEIQLAAGLLVAAFGLYKLFARRHPRFLTRIGPSHLTLWSFLMATAHGAGLMLVPVILGLCAGPGAAHGGHQALLEIARGGLGLTLAAASVHTLAMVATGGALAWLVYRHLGLKLLRRSWLNVDLLWAALLVAAGGVGVAAAARGFA